MAYKDNPNLQSKSGTQYKNEWEFFDLMNINGQSDKIIGIAGISSIISVLNNVFFCQKFILFWVKEISRQEKFWNNIKNIMAQLRYWKQFETKLKSFSYLPSDIYIFCSK